MVGAPARVDPRARAPVGRRSVTVALSHHAGDDRLFANLAEAIAPLRRRSRDPPATVAGRAGGRRRDRRASGRSPRWRRQDHRPAGRPRRGDGGVRRRPAGHRPALPRSRRRRPGGDAVPRREPRTEARRAQPAPRAGLRSGSRHGRRPPGRRPAGPRHRPADRRRRRQRGGGGRHTLQLLRLLLDGGDFDEPSGLAGLPLSAGSGTW